MIFKDIIIILLSVLCIIFYLINKNTKIKYIIFLPFILVIIHNKTSNENLLFNLVIIGSLFVLLLPFINNKKLLDVNEVAQIDMILYLYHLCKAYNYTSEERILKEQFEDKYKSLNVKINLKKKVKYYMFSRFPNFVAYIISLKQRKYHVR